MTELVNVLPPEQVAAFERQKRAHQNAAYFAAQKGEMSLVPRGKKSVFCIVLYNGVAIGSENHGRSWRTKHGVIKDAETLRILRARFNERFQRWLNSRPDRLDSTHRNTSGAFNWVQATNIRPNKWAEYRDLKFYRV